MADISENSFVHLNVHSDYSLTHSIACIDNLVSRAAELGQDTLALTDIGNLFGVIEFTRSCKEHNIRPIIGCMMWVVEDHLDKKNFQPADTLIFLCKNKKGFYNLKKLSTLGYIEGFRYVPRISLSLIEQYSEGLVCIVSQHKGVVTRCLNIGKKDYAENVVKQLKNIFKDDLYIELQNHGQTSERKINDVLKELATQLEIECVAGNDCFYVERDDALAHEVFLKNNKHKFRDFIVEEFYLKSAHEMYENFDEHEDAFFNTRVVADKCKFNITFPGPQLPDFPIPEQFKDYSQYLEHLVFEGLKKRYKKRLPKEILDRANYELKVIIDMGFSGYFLIMWDIIAFAESKGIPVGLGRGSAAGSIVAYALGITGLDPLKYGLLFERFLNPERISMPDIDTDFCVNGRQEVIDYIRHKYGEDRVGQIITFSALKPRGAIRDVARALHMELSIVDRIAKLIPYNAKNLAEAKEKESELKKYEKEYPQLFDVTEQLLGVHRHASLHAAGVVIGKEPLVDYLPLYRDPKTGSVATQYTMDYLEDCGLVKMDILGLRTVTILESAQEKIKEVEPNFDIEAISETDEETFEMLSRGESDAVFQFESDGMKRVLRSVKPSRIEDLIALNALYRPGPMDNIPEYAAVKNGEKKAHYQLKELESILEETYGVIVYQEQVMRIAQVIAGYSLGAADILRRAMGKKKKAEMDEQKTIFIQGAMKMGYQQDAAEALFNLLLPFADYGFNKSHAAAYAVLAYRTAYLKCHYPLMFLTSQLNAIASNLDDVEKNVQVCRDMGVTVLPPDVNHSSYLFTIEHDCIRYGLNAIKTISEEYKRYIPEEREKNGNYKSIINLLERLPNANGLPRFLEAAIPSGLFDSIDENRGLLLSNREYFASLGKERQKAYSQGRSLLFTAEEDDSSRIRAYPNDEEDDSVFGLEKEYLGAYFRYHPVKKIQNIWEQETTLHLKRLSQYAIPKNFYEKHVKHHYLVCYIAEVNIFYKSKNPENNNANDDLKNMRKTYVGTATDLNGSIKFVYSVNATDDHVEIREHTLCALVGSLDHNEEDGYVLWVNKSVSVDDVHKVRIEDKKSESVIEKDVYAKLHLFFTEKPSNDRFEKMKEYFENNSGQTLVFLHVPVGNNQKIKVQVSRKYAVDAEDKKFISALRKHPLIERIRLE